MRKAVEERSDSVDQLVTALREGTRRAELRFNFAQLGTFSDADLQRVSESLPCSFCASVFFSAVVFSGARRSFPRLRRICKHRFTFVSQMESA